jgi:hypothetical protein
MTSSSAESTVHESHLTADQEIKESYESKLVKDFEVAEEYTATSQQNPGNSVQTLEDMKTDCEHTRQYYFTELAHQLIRT